MSRQLRCPNCGGEHTLVNPGITMMVCSFCQTVVYWDAASVLQLGQKSLLPEADTRLFLHATGKLRGQSFEVVGHLRYQYARGTWEEWYLQLAEERVAWLSEDERELTLEQSTRLDAPPPSPTLQLGQAVSVDGATCTVREAGHATLIGGEGQLPFVVLPGEEHAYFDLASSDGARFATLEIYPRSTPQAYAGQVLTHAELEIDGEPPPSAAGSHEGKHIKCSNCDAVLELQPDREVKTVVCAYCGAQNDLTGAEARVAGINPKDFEPDFIFEVGQAGTFQGVRYEICGRMLYQDDEGYLTREYLLFHPSAGYLWLAEENGHYVLNTPTQQAPAGNPFGLSPKQSIRAGATTFQFYESGTVRLRYVDGALPWRAACGDTFRYADLIAPPRMLSVEHDGQELEYFLGRYLPPAEVQSAFAKTAAPLRAFGVHPAQPFQRGPLAKMLMVIGGVFALVNLALFGWSTGHRGELLFEQRFTSADYLGESFSNAFSVGAGRVMAMSISAPLSNSWLSLDVALVDTGERVVEEVGGDLSYYFGYEEGESWSEGRLEETSYFKAPPPGRYKLLLKATGGSGASGPCRGEPLSVRVYQGTILSRYFLTLAIVAFLFPFFELLRRRLFENRRWAPVVGDDSNDDDD